MVRGFREEDVPRPLRMGKEGIVKKRRERQERASRRRAGRLAELQELRRWLRWAPGTRL